METRPIARISVQMWKDIKKECEAQDVLEVLEHTQLGLHEQAMKLYMTEVINSRKAPRPSGGDAKPEDQNSCTVCGRELTERELKYINDTGGKKICYHCSVKNK